MRQKIDSKMDFHAEQSASFRRSRPNSDVTAILIMKKKAAHISRSAADNVGPATLVGGRLENTRLAMPNGDRSNLGRDAVERLIRLAFRLKEQRQQLVENERIDEVAWCMLLDLYLGHLKNTTLYVSALCTNTYAAPTTALRRLDDLVGCGFAARQRNHSDARRISVVLTATGLEKAHAYICHIHSEAYLALSPEISHWRPPKREYFDNDVQR